MLLSTVAFPPAKTTISWELTREKQLQRIPLEGNQEVCPPTSSLTQLSANNSRFPSSSLERTNCLSIHPRCTYFFFQTSSNCLRTSSTQTLFKKSFLYCHHHHNKYAQQHFVCIYSPAHMNHKIHGVIWELPLGLQKLACVPERFLSGLLSLPFSKHSNNNNNKKNSHVHLLVQRSSTEQLGTAAAAAGDGSEMQRGSCEMPSLLRLPKLLGGPKTGCSLPAGCDIALARIFGLRKKVAS